MPDICTADSGVCATCGHFWHAPMKVGGRIVAWDTYCSECNNEHPYVPRPCGAAMVEGPCAVCGDLDADHDTLSRYDTYGGDDTPVATCFTYVPTGHCPVHGAAVAA